MSEKVLNPDLKFVKDVVSSGGESLKKCFQCATCTVVCNLTPPDKPFPRKEMVHAQWGLKEDLFGNPDIWLCHQCSDCTAYCPRGAKPGEVLGTIRQMSLERYSAPGFLAKALRDSKYLIFLAVVPVIILLALISIQDYSLGDIPRGDEGQMVYSKFVPTTFGIDPIYMAAMIFAVVVLAKGVMKYWADMSRTAGMKVGFGEAIVPVIKDILSHSKFRECNVTVKRGTSHLLVFYSFLVLGVTTALAAAREYVHSLEEPLYAPMKVLGNVGAVALAVGILLVIMNRFANAEKAGKGGYYDWLFISLIVVIAATGILSELFRLGNMNIGYPVYFAHLASVLFLFIYAPFSKMAHMIYRATAMVFAKAAGRE